MVAAEHRCFARTVVFGRKWLVQWLVHDVGRTSFDEVVAVLRGYVVETGVASLAGARAGRRVATSSLVLAAVGAALLFLRVQAAHLKVFHDNCQSNNYLN